MLVKISSLFFLVIVSIFGQNSFDSEMKLLKQSSQDTNASSWDAVSNDTPSQQLSEDSISIKSSALQKQPVPKEKKTQMKQKRYGTRKRSR